MAREFSRTQRVGEQIQRELGTILQREIKDPRVGLVTCTAVEVSRDFSYAKVFVTLLGKEEDPAAIKETLQVLNNAAGFVRTLLAKIIQIRTIPKLRFVYDESVINAQRIQHLINTAVLSDEEQQQDESDSEPKPE